MPPPLTLSELVAAVNAWCDEHGVQPASGQAADRLSERNVRFYRTVGLLDAPESGGGRGYSERHRLQLIAVRLLQAQGLPLLRIRELLYGRSLRDLRHIERRGLAELSAARTSPVANLAGLAAGESWTMVPLDADFLLLSRRGRAVPPALLAQIRDLLQKA